MDEDNEKRVSIIVLMIIVLICILFFGLVAFGYMSSPSGSGSGSNSGVNSSSTIGTVAGTIFYHDGVTPLALNNTASKTDLLLVDTDYNNYFFVTDDTGNYTTQVPAGQYNLVAYNNNVNIGHVNKVNVTANSTIQVNLTTSKMPMNQNKEPYLLNKMPLSSLPWLL
jgi:hypothetical protein